MRKKVENKAFQKKLMGRPKITTADFGSDWEEHCYRLAAVGCSDLEIRVQALDGIYHETFERLMKEDPHFFEVLTKCKQMCENWWKTQGRINLENGKFSPTLWYMNMKNRFGWKDKQDITSNDREMSGPVIYIPEED